MASPSTMGNSAAWMGGPSGHGQPPPPSHGVAGGGNESGMSVRPMGLKVSYTFDKDSQQNCLARWPHILHVQTVPLDDTTTIGLVDLRTCLQAIAEGSPEIAGQQEKDYTVYALDFSEEDTPLVGQGMLSWGLEPPTANSEQKMITGRVTKNPLALFSNGTKEVLEVKLKLNAVPKMQRPGTSHHASRQQQGFANNAPTPPPSDVNNEWSSLMQSNPNLGYSAHIGTVSSPALGPVHPNSRMHQGIPGPPEGRPDRGFPLPAAHTPPPPSAGVPQPPAPMSIGLASNEITLAPKPGEIAPPRSARSGSRPSSRASGRGGTGKKPTGNPRGRPRKNKLASDSGNTSALEDPTDVEEGPKKKRAKTTKADWSNQVPLDAAPDSLRVAASTSGSLRTMRPAGAGIAAGLGASHLQEVPRAPTPIAMAPAMNPRGRKPSATQPRRQSMAEFEGISRPQTYDTSMFMPQSQDARSPTESMAQSPFQAYTPADSPGDIGSSPPVPRSAAFIQSSPVASSPILPPMSMPLPDSGFMSGSLDDINDVDELPLAMSMPLTRDQSAPVLAPRPPPSLRRVQTQNSDGAMTFEQVNPGPLEMLPKESLCRPKKSTKTLNKTKGKTSGKGAGKKAGGRQLNRANTEPNLQRQEQPDSGIALSAPPPLPLPQPGSLQLLLPQPDPLPQPEARELQIESERPEQPEQAAADPPATLQLSLPQPEITEPTVHKPFPVPTNSAPGVQESAETNDDPILRLQMLGGLLDTDNDTRMIASELSPMPAPQLPPMNKSLEAISVSSELNLTVPASDPVVGTKSNLPPPAFSDAPGPSSDLGTISKQKKNLVKKMTIKNKIVKALELGEMPLYCSTCGAIETPTWRKMWIRDYDGCPPEITAYSEKAGHVTAHEILKTDEDGKSERYRVIKKTLTPEEKLNKEAPWTEVILCNPCGIWLSKYHVHRPMDRWEKDESRLGKPRTRRAKGEKNSRSKKSRAKSEGGINPTSDAYFTTDPAGPADQGSSPMEEDGGGDDEPRNSIELDRQGSTHSRGSGTAQSPITVDNDLGVTRRLLFPSPRKDGMPKVLGEVAINVVKTAPDYQASKEAAAGQENMAMAPPVTPKVKGNEDDDMADLFGTPPARPSTPLPKANSGVMFKTPTKPTPSHRPITRSVSKSIRSVRSIGKSPNHAIFQLQQTPTKSSSIKRRSDRNLHAHFVDNGGFGMNTNFDALFTTQLDQLLSEANNFTQGSPAHGIGDLDLSTLNSDDFNGHFTGALDFGNLMSTDIPMPSSPPMLGQHGGGHSMEDSFDASLTFDESDMSMWEQLQGTVSETPVDDEQPVVEEMN